VNVKEVVIRLPWGGQLTKDRCPIGRETHESLNGMPKTMSRVHLEVRMAEDGGVFAKDLGSTNGTWLATRQVGADDDVTATLDLPAGESSGEAAAEAEAVEEMLGCLPVSCNTRVIFSHADEEVFLQKTTGEVRVDLRYQYLVLGGAKHEITERSQLPVHVCIRFLPVAEEETETQVVYKLTIERVQLQKYVPPVTGEGA
jgi:hypothetical protein